MRLTVGKLAMGVATVLLLGSLAGAPVAASAPPVGSSTTYACQAFPAGYSPLVGAGYNKDGTPKAFVWDGRLRWELCAAKTGSGNHYAIVQLSALLDAGRLVPTFTGTVSIKLQKCTSSGYTTVASTTWAESSGRTYETKNAAGTHEYWLWQRTPNTSSSATRYRVRVSGYGAVVPVDGPYISLTPTPYGPPPGTDPAVYASSCMTP